MKPERRYDEHGPIVLMAEVDGYLMVRRPRMHPGVMTVKEWLALDPNPPSAGQETQSNADALNASGIKDHRQLGAGFW